MHVRRLLACSTTPALGFLGIWCCSIGSGDLIARGRDTLMGPALPRQWDACCHGRSGMASNAC